jgi:hypothetical protein
MKFLIICTLVALVWANARYDETLRHLKEREGSKTVGYLPTTSSGVTIGIGIDLGQQSKSDLIRRGVPTTIINKVQKYLGYKSKAALDAAHLAASSLVLSTSEAEQLSKPFIMDSYNVVLPYATKMDNKGMAVLVSLRHWAGSLGCMNCKLSINAKNVETNYLWDAIKSKTASNAAVKSALQKTLAGKTVGSVAYNRIKHEITYLG